MKKRTKLTAMGIALAIMLCVWIAHGNQNVGLTTYEQAVSGLPGAFDGLRIVQLSDLHNVSFGDDNQKLISVIARAQPDMIFITGDMLDSRKTDIEAALNIADSIVSIAPTYYVNGNHEARLAEYEDFESSLEKCGITVLRNRAVQLEREGAVINITGVDDPSFASTYFDSGAESAAVESAIDKMDTEGCTLLLAHRPELFDVYAENGIELAFCGHTHGGQIRLPLLGGLYAPGLGFLPEYDGGLYHKGGSAMIVSRGIGNSIFPFRVNNDPEVILAILSCG